MASSDILKFDFILDEIDKDIKNTTQQVSNIIIDSFNEIRKSLTNPTKNSYNLFEEIISQSESEGVLLNQSRESLIWFRDSIQQLSNPPSPNNLLSAKERLRPSPQIGNMYSFFYSPKYKDTLPYYDIFPLIFPIEYTSNGFLGINLHYLPLDLRFKFMLALYSISSNQELNDKTKLNLSYNMLKSTAKMNYFKPTLKRYLNSHVESKFLYIHPKEWNIALFLPVERFQKRSKQFVWDDSRRKI